MFDTLTTPQRVQVGLILAMAFLLVLGSNRLDQRHFSTIQTTVNSVYKDRVVVQNIIYQLNTIFHQKELQLLEESNPNSTGSSRNSKVEDLLANFEATELTFEEYNLLQDFKDLFSDLKKLETTPLETSLSGANFKPMPAIQKIKQIEEKLNGLAEIQLEQSEQLTQVSNKSLGMTILLSQLEVAFLLIIGIAMAVLIFYPINTEEMTS
ncbi:hypothetical protein LCGC14_0580230 [marine sediment metagenome]|uniref:Chemotaxis methyl-accepting receptor HlyB-like 4HB MCP domain-containing protein n=2 Tax=root TaxID=1 RepID=A0A831VVF3_9FLAO|nr:hypothetical protein [Pricia antarctica]